MSNDKNKLLQKQDVVHLAILIAIALVIGVYLIVTTVLISKDGVFYIERAQRFASDPVEIIKAHPPGYPFLIMAAHKCAGLFTDSTSNQVWIYSAQSVTLLCRLLALIPLYFIGKLLVGSKNSFLALLIFIFLPYPTKIVCDVVREWPYLLFLSTGFFFLLWSAKSGKWWLFGLVGLSSGLGYWIRPESAQLIIYGLLWGMVSLFRPKLWCVYRLKTVAALALLLIGFAIPAAPYMKCAGRVIPRKIEGIMKSFSYNTLPDKTDMPKVNTISSNYNTAEIVPVDVLKALGDIFKKIGEILIWFFVPMLIIGFWGHFRQDVKYEERFLITVFFTMNIAMMVLRYCYFEQHVSQRWSLPLVMFTVFYIPSGLQIMGNWLNNKCAPSKQKIDILKDRRLSWFAILFLIGVGICLPKLLQPVRLEKQGYRKAANWLRGNTSPNDILAVFDNRIGLYSERNWCTYEENVSPKVTTLNLMRAAIGAIKIAKGRNNFEHSVFLVTKAKETTKSTLAETIEYQSSSEDTFLTELSKYSALKDIVGYWPNGTAEDFSIFNNNTTFHGNVKSEKSKYGHGYRLSDNSADYITCGNNPILNPTDAVSLSILIHPTSASMGSIVTKNGPYSMEYLSNGKIKTGIHAGSPPTWTFSTTESSLSLNTWHHIVMTYDGTHITTYVNNKIDGVPTAKTGRMASTRSPVFIGYGRPGFDYYFKGMIDEVMIFQKALSEKEINALSKMIDREIIPSFNADSNAETLIDVWSVGEVYSLSTNKPKRNETVMVYKLQ